MYLCTEILDYHYNIDHSIVCQMNRRIVTFGGFFEEFYRALDDRVQNKIDYALELLKTEERVSAKFVKYLRGGLFELRAEIDGNIYRVFFIFDNGNIVVLFNGFQKKSQKTPANEIEKAIKIKEAYYEFIRRQRNVK